MSKLIEVSNLSVFSKTKTLVKDISFSIQKKETIALIGESGSGKSLTALALMGFLPKGLFATGSALYQGVNLLSLSEKEWRPIRREKVSIVLQNPMTSLNPTMTIGQQIFEAFPNKPKPTHDHVLSLLDEVGIPQIEAFSRFPHHYSGGQRQRIAIAIALASKPEFLVADEPTTALDLTVQKQIMDLLKNLQSAYQFSLLFITHDIPLVKEFCTRTLVMYHGDILESGDTETLLKKPKHPYTLSLLESFRSLSRGEIQMHTGKLIFPYDRGCPFSLRCPYAMEICPNENPMRKEKCWLYDKEAQEMKRIFDHAVNQI